MDFRFIGKAVTQLGKLIKVAGPIIGTTVPLLQDREKNRLQDLHAAKTHENDRLQRQLDDQLRRNEELQRQAELQRVHSQRLEENLSALQQTSRFLLVAVAALVVVGVAATLYFIFR